MATPKPFQFWLAEMQWHTVTGITTLMKSNRLVAEVTDLFFHTMKLKTMYFIPTG